MFTWNPAAIAIDLDGTLLDSSGALSERSRKALEACVERGLPVVIATSRPARSASRLLGRQLLNTLHLVQMNGAAAQRGLDGDAVFIEQLPQEAATTAVELSRRMVPSARLTVELQGWEFGSSHPLPPEQLWSLNSATPDMVMTVEEALRLGPAKVGVSGRGQDLRPLGEVLLRRLDGVASVLPADGWTFLNIVSRNATKEAALKRLLDPLGVSLNDALAIGDDYADIGLLAACGLPVAVANAIPEVKAVARYVTASNDDDGVALVLERVLSTAR